MMLRCPARVALAGALVAFGLGSRPPASQAASVSPNASTATATYRLTSTAGLPAPDPNLLSQIKDGTAAPQVVAMVAPPGSIIPPTNADGTQASPLTILPDSHGFDTKDLSVLLPPAGNPETVLGLVFGSQGLQPGGSLHFTLSIDKALASNPPTLTPLTPGISITADPISTTGTTNGVGGGGNSGDGTQVPEPLGIVLWSSVLVGLAARRRLRPRPLSR